MPREHHWILAREILTVCSLILAGAILFYFLSAFLALPVPLLVLIQVVLAASVGLLAIGVLGRALRRMVSRTFNPGFGATVSVAFRLAGYVVLSFVVLGLLGVSGTALLAGGTFAGLVLGLAGTTVLSNVFGGVLLLIARPFEVGDRVTITTWQYGVVVPAYPGKFFSDDRFVPGYTGVVEDLSLTYTAVALDDGPLMKFPNNVMVQAAVLRHSNPRWVRTRYEVPGHPDPERLLEAVAAAVRRNPWIVDPYRVQVLLQAITPTSTILAVDALCKSAFEDPPRSSILLDVSRAAASLGASEG
ncbi:MAG TPA: mechanosensitive ion channel family protein [Thermoplasmata archaeon]|nr:mechanosensitive ion channel family protein [Thermoplasmata archaeon]